MSRQRQEPLPSYPRMTPPPSVADLGPPPVAPALNLCTRCNGSGSEPGPPDSFRADMRACERDRHGACDVHNHGSASERAALYGLCPTCHGPLDFAVRRDSDGWNVGATCGKGCGEAEPAGAGEIPKLIIEFRGDIRPEFVHSMRRLALGNARQQERDRIRDLAGLLGATYLDHGQPMPFTNMLSD